MNLQLLTKRSRQAWTLVELLVVIAIIGLLAMLGLGAMAAAKQRSQETVCLNNLRQIQIGLKLYQGDYQSRLPLLRCMKDSPGTLPAAGSTGSDWWDFGPTLGGKDPGPSQQYALAKDRPLYSYVKNPEVFHCPADKGWSDPARNVRALPSCWSVFGCSYYYNARSNTRPSLPADWGTPGLANKSEETVHEASRFVLVYEYPLHNRGQEPMILWHRAKSSESLFLTQHYDQGRKLVTPFLFLDGHAQFLTFAKGEIPWSSPRLLWETGAL